MRTTSAIISASRSPSEEIEDLDERLSHETAEATSPDLVPVLAANLRRLRKSRGLSLERLAMISRVSRAMLSQIELAYSAPTINVIWRIASALGVPFGALLAQHDDQGPHVLRAAQAKVLTSHDGRFSSRALFPFDAVRPRRSELYELILRARCVENAEPHAPGTIENLVVANGRVRVTVQGETFRLEEGDSIRFVADVPHTYENPDPQLDAVAYLAMTYAGDAG